MGHPPVIRTDEIDAVVFDLDGVITKTAIVHAGAWTSLFDGYLQEVADRTGGEFVPFTDEDYRRYVDGKPRYDGVHDFLASRGIDLPWGDPSDSPSKETVCGLGNRKNRHFLEYLRTRGVEPYSTSVNLVRGLQAKGIGTALISASRNAYAVLASAGIDDLFDVRVDGVVAGELGLPGKPDPAVFLEAARRLGAGPDRTAIVEDAQAGVEAGRRGGFALVIGVDRADQADLLRAGGADVVVDDLGEVEVTGERRAPTAAGLPSAFGLTEPPYPRFEAVVPAVFLDYDGTLTPIVEHPDLAVLSDEGRAALERTARVATVAIVSGRDVADVRDKVRVEGIYYAGSHGFDIIGPSGRAVDDEDLSRFDRFLPDLDQAQRRLEAALKDVPGANIERKRFAIAVHYRQVPDEHYPRIEQAVEEVAPDFPQLRVTTGKKIFELRPGIDWDKGKALDWLLTEMALDHAGIVPLYIGDDTTDEDAFRVLRDRGIGIVVGREDRRSAAAYVLDDPGEVIEFLNGLAAMLEERAE